MLHLQQISSNGSSFIGLGMLGLVAAVIQHTRMLQRSEAPDYAYNAMRPITVTAAITLLMIGVFGVVGIFYDQYRDRISKKSRR